MTNIIEMLANGTGWEPPIPKAPIPNGPGGTIDVVAYNANSDPNAENFLPWFWQRLRNDGLVSLYFPGSEQTGFAAFVKLFSGTHSVLLVYRRDLSGEIVDTVGFATLELMQFGQATAAHAGFIFLRDYWDHHSSKEAAERIAATWFGWIDPKLDVVIGIIAEQNVLARRFLQRIGWEHSGNLPYIHHYNGARSDASIWFLTRERFEKGNR